TFRGPSSRCATSSARNPGSRLRSALRTRSNERALAEIFLTRLGPAALGRKQRFFVELVPPLAERISVPGRLRGNGREAELAPQLEATLHELALGQRDGRQLVA